MCSQLRRIIGEAHGRCNLLVADWEKADGNRIVPPVEHHGSLCVSSRSCRLNPLIATLLESTVFGAGFGDATVWLHANGNVGIGQSNPTAKLTVEGTVQSNSGGGSVQTTAANAAYTKIRANESSVFVPDDQSYISILHLDLPTGAYLVTATFDVANLNSGYRNVRCRFTGDNNLDYYFSIFPSTQLISMHTVQNIASGGVDIQCKVLFTNGGGQSEIFVDNSRLTAVKIAGNVNVQ